MNELDQIRDAYPTQPAPTPEATRLARTQLQDLARAEAATTRRRRLPAGFTPIRLGIGLTTAAATVAVVALGVPLLTPDNDPGASTPPAAGSPDQSTTPPAAAPTASQLLLVAAAQQEKAAATTGKYFRVRTVSTILIPAGRYGLTYALNERRISESWTGTAGGTSYRGSRELGVSPATPEDEAKWRAAGSPTTWNFGPTDTVDQHDLIKSTKPGKGELLELKNQADRYFEVGGDKGVSTAEILALPTTPEALSARLLKDKPSRAVAASTTSYLVAVTTDLLRSTPATPKTRAAGLRLLAGLPGAVVKENVRDPLGRTVTAIAFATPDPQGTGSIQLFVDPKTGQLLGSTITGTKSGSGTVLEAGWTNEKPTVPSATIR